jgi:hypothetical protein
MLRNIIFTPEGVFLGDQIGENEALGTVARKRG